MLSTPFANYSVKAKCLLILMGFMGNMDFCMLPSEGMEPYRTRLSHRKHRVVTCLRIKKGKKKLTVTHLVVLR